MAIPDSYKYKFVADDGSGSEDVGVSVEIPLADEASGEDVLGGDWDVANELSETGSGQDDVAISSTEALAESAVGVDAVEIVRGDISDPLTDYRPHTAKLYMAVRTPRIVWTARVTAAREDSDDTTLEYDTGANEVGFDIDNFGTDLTLWLGSSAEAKDVGICRFLSKTGDTIEVRADSSVSWSVGDYISITDVHELWPRVHKVEATDDQVTVFKDLDIPAAERELQPVPVLGPPACAFLSGGSVDVDFNGSLSYVVPPGLYPYFEDPDPQTGIVAYDWWFESGTPSTSSSATATVTYTTAGRYVVRLTVTAIDGTEYTGYRDVFIFDDENPPITEFALREFSGSIDQQGWSTELTVWGSTASLSSIASGAMVVLFAEEKFGGSTRATDPWFPGRENIKLVGWVAEAGFTLTKEGATARLSVNGLGQYLDRYTNYPVYFTSVNTDSEAWSYIDELTVSQVLYHLIRWHWVLICFTDVFVTTYDDAYITGQTFPAGSLSAQLNAIVGDIQSYWTTTKGGALHVFKRGNLNASHQGNIVTWYLREADIETLDIEPRPTLGVSQVKVSGVYQSYPDGEQDNAAYEATIPPNNTGYVGETKEYNNQVLTSVQHASYLAQQLYAQSRQVVHRVRVTLTGNHSTFDLAPLHRLLITYEPATVLRGVSWDDQPFWVVEVQNEVDYRNGAIQTSVVLIPEVVLEEGALLSDNLLGDPVDVTPVNPETPEDGGGTDTEDETDEDALIPALMGYSDNVTTPTWKWHRGDSTYVRLYGDTAQAVWAANPGFKAVWARGVWVRKDKRPDTRYTSGKYTYMIVAVMDTEEGVAKSYTLNQPVWFFAGPWSLWTEAGGGKTLAGGAVYTLPDEAMYWVGGYVYARTTGSGSGVLTAKLYADDVYQGILGDVYYGQAYDSYPEDLGSSWSDVELDAGARLEISLEATADLDAQLEDISVGVLLRQVGT